MLAPQPQVHHLSQLLPCPWVLPRKAGKGFALSLLADTSGMVLTELMECPGLREGLVVLPVSLGRV